MSVVGQNDPEQAAPRETTSVALDVTLRRVLWIDAKEARTQWKHLGR